MQVLAIAVCILEVKKKSPCVKGENKYFSCSANSLSSVSWKMVVKLRNSPSTEVKYLMQ